MPAMEDLAQQYSEKIKPYILQGITNGAIWGSMNMPVSNIVRKDILDQALQSPEFKAFGDDSIFHLAQKQWPTEMFSLQSIMMPSGNPWIENWDEKSAHEGFLAGVRFACEQAVNRITAICKA